MCPSVGLERCKPVGHLLSLLHVMSFNKITLMNEIILCFLISMHVNIIYYGFNLEGVTTWYQSVPGSNTLGTWEVISITMGLSRLLET